MKKKSNHTKREYAEWNEHGARNYNWDGVEDEASDELWESIEEAEGSNTEETETVYSEDAGEYYGEEESYEAEGEYYSEEESYEAEGEYYSEEESYEAEDEYYSEEEGYEAEDEYYSEEEGYEAEDEYYEQEITYEEEYYGQTPYQENGYAAKDEQEDDDEAVGLFGFLKGRFAKMGAMDWVVALTGVLVLLLVLITGGVYLGRGMNDDGMSALAGVGTQLEGITMIGEKGLLAVADAEIAKQMASELMDQEGENGEDESGYDEEEYSNAVKVKMNLTSVKKDLKIKFTNRENGKLVSNVPFSVTVTAPDGDEEIWQDDDMDGIIYHKEIPAGNYTVAVNELEDEKYKKYTLPAAPQTVKVKKEIAYEKVDVSNEVKTEAEIDASKEDTKINETVIESTLKDTVTWVESTVVAETYTEISKNTVVNPMEIAMAGRFMRTAAVQPDVNPTTGSGNEGAGSGNTGTETPEGGNTGTETPEGGNTGTETPEGGNTGTETPEGGNTGTETPEGGNTGTETPEGGNAGTETPEGGNPGGEVQENAAFTIQITPKNLELVVEGQGTAKVELQGATAGQEMEYSVVSGDTTVATAQIDANGNLTVTALKKGKTLLAVTVGYKNGADKKPTTEVLNVNVSDLPVITLEKTEAEIYITEPLTLNVTMSTEGTQGELSAESSDTKIATAVVENKKLTITGVAEGDAVITVKYTQNGKEVKATCAVKIKIHPKDNVKELLKDSKGEQVYVKQNDAYREAVYADYYTADKFYVKGDVKYTGWQTLNGKVYYYTAAGEKVTGEQVIQGAKYNFASDGSLVTGSGVLGIDVSKWNGKIDWKAVKNSGVSYVIIRCGYRGSTGGSIIEDPKFATNIKGATDAGLKVGVYFFSQAIDEVEAVEEASYVLDKIKKYKISYPVFLDVEPSGGRADKIDKTTRTAVCKAFCETIQRAGYTAGIYANKSWLETKIDPSKLGGYKIWLAQYAATPTYTGRYDMWQYKSTGKISGISGDVDMNLSYLGY